MVAVTVQLLTLVADQLASTGMVLDVAVCGPEDALGPIKPAERSVPLKRTLIVIIGVTITVLADAAAADKQSECATYARVATNQAIMASNLKCGFSGLRWVTDSKSHLSWCMELADPYEARIAKERAEQMKELAACARQHAKHPVTDKPSDSAKGCSRYLPSTGTTVSVPCDE